MKKLRVLIAAMMVGFVALQAQPKPANALIGVYLVHEGEMKEANGGNSHLESMGWVLAGVGALLTGYLVPIIACVGTIGEGCTKTTFTNFGYGVDQPGPFGQFGAFSHAGLWVNLLGLVLLDSPQGATIDYAPVADASQFGMTVEQQNAYNNELETINIAKQDFMARTIEYQKTAASNEDTQNYIHGLWQNVAKPNLSDAAFAGLTKVSQSLQVPASAQK